MKNIIFSHGPPKDTCADLVTTVNNLHVGSVDIRMFLQAFEVDSIFCGHIH